MTRHRVVFSRPDGARRFPKAYPLELCRPHSDRSAPQDFAARFLLSKRCVADFARTRLRWLAGILIAILALIRFLGLSTNKVYGRFRGDFAALVVTYADHRRLLPLLCARLFFRRNLGCIPACEKRHCDGTTGEQDCEGKYNSNQAGSFQHGNLPETLNSLSSFRHDDLRETLSALSNFRHWKGFRASTS
jgi:hypothetical protein